MTQKYSSKSGRLKGEIKRKLKTASSIRNKVHVISHGNSWAVKKERSGRVDGIFASKKDAVGLAISVADRGSAIDSVVVHKKDGSIESCRKISKK